MGRFKPTFNNGQIKKEAEIYPNEHVSGKTNETRFFDKNNAKKHYNEFITFMSHSNLVLSTFNNGFLFVRNVKSCF